jgi:hypothetical protein
MPYATPRTWATGDLATAAMLNQDVRDNVSSLANPPACRVYHNTTQSIGDATEVTVAFNAERFDTNTMHDTATNNSRITFNTAGLYVVHFTGALPALTTYSLIYAVIIVNGATRIAYDLKTPTTFSAAPVFNVNTTYKFAAADYAQVLVYQDNTANTAQNLASSAAYSPEFAATWIGLG